MLFLDGVYVTIPSDLALRFVPVNPSSRAELARLTRTIAQRIGRHLGRHRLFTQDDEQKYLAMDTTDAGPLDGVLGYAITYRVSVGPNWGRKVFTRRTRLPEETANPFTEIMANETGFSLHVGITVRPQERDKLERLCRYRTRPSIAGERLSLTRQGRVRYELKTFCRNGTTHVLILPTRLPGRARRPGAAARAPHPLLRCHS